MKVKFPILIYILFLTHFSFANEVDQLLNEVSPRTRLSNTHLRVLREELKIQTLIIEGIKQIQLDTGSFKVPGNIESTLERIIRKSIQAKSETIPHKVGTELKDILTTKIDKEGLTKFLNKFFQAFAKNAKGQGILMSSITRRFGMQVGLVYFVSLQVDLTYPLVLIGTGSVAKGIGLMSLPISPVIAGGFAALKSAIKKRSLMKKLGFANLKKSLKNFKLIRKYFNQHFLEAKNLIEVNINKRSLLSP